MAYTYVDYLGGYDATKCTNWTVQQNSYKTNLSETDFEFGNSPVDLISRSDMPIQWNITEHLSVKFYEKPSDTNFIMFEIYYDDSLGYTGNISVGNDPDCKIALGAAIEELQSSNHACFLVFARSQRYSYTNKWQGHTDPITNNDVTRLYPYLKEASSPPTVLVANGGGATHIAKRTGLLKDLSSHLSDILMVSGGGGGGLLIGEDTYDGKDAGGISGSGNNSGNQSTGYAFGKGESGEGVSAGGGGLYGGYRGNLN